MRCFSFHRSSKFPYRCRMTRWESRYIHSVSVSISVSWRTHFIHSVSVSIACCDARTTCTLSTCFVEFLSLPLALSIRLSVVFPVHTCFRCLPCPHVFLVFAISTRLLFALSIRFFFRFFKVIYKAQTRRYFTSLRFLRHLSSRLDAQSIWTSEIYLDLSSSSYIW